MRRTRSGVRVRPRFAVASVLGVGALLSGVIAAHAAPSPSSVTVGVADSDPTSATVNGGPVSGQGDNGLGQPLNPCPPGACESFTINLTAPGGYNASHVIKLAVSVSTTTPVPPNPQAGTIDTYLEDSSGAVLSSDAGSHNPSLTAVADAAPGTYILEVVGSTGADNSYVATITASSSARVSGLPHDISFAPSTVVSPIIVGGEPQVTLEHSQANSQGGAIDANRGFIDWPLSSRTNIGTLWRTTDGGNSFRQLYDLTCAQRQRPNCLTGGGGDTVNRVNFYNGHLLFGDQESLAAEAYAQSNDHGDSFPPTTQTPITAGGTAVDRQWIAPVAGPGYMAGPTDSYALEGIFSYHIPLAGIYVSGIDASGVVHPAVVTQVTGVDQSGDNVVDTTGGPGDGWLYLSYRTTGLVNGCPPCGFVVATVPLNQFETPGLSPTGAYHLNQVNSDIPEVFPWITLDNQGNAYAAWVTGGKVYMAYSLINDRHNNPHATPPGVPGTLWSSKVQVNPPAIGSTLFPEIVAGDPGHVAITYVGTTEFTGVSDNAAGAHWYTMASITSNAFDPAPTFATGPVSHRVVHTGTLCTSGTTCVASMGDRSLLDMIDLSYDNDGRVGVVYSNNNNAFGRQEVSEGSQGSPYIMFAKLSDGPSLFNGHGPFSDTYPSQCRSAPAGDATWPNHLTGASNIPALDILGDCLYDDGNGNLVARIDLADASSAGMQSALTAYNAVTSTDVPAQRVQYVVRFESANDVGYMAFENAGGTESAYGGVVNSSNAITNGSSAVGTFYSAQNGFTVTATRSGNSLFLSAPMAQFGISGNDTLTSVTAFSNAGPGAQSLGGQTLQDGSTILNIDRVVDSAPPFDAVVAPLLNTSTPEAPTLLLLPAIGGALSAVGVVRMRRRRHNRSS